MKRCYFIYLLSLSLFFSIFHPSIDAKLIYAGLANDWTSFENAIKKNDVESARLILQKVPQLIEYNVAFTDGFPRKFQGGPKLSPFGVDAKPFGVMIENSLDNYDPKMKGNIRGASLLCLAAHYGSTAIAKELLQAGAKPNFSYLEVLRSDLPHDKEYPAITWNSYFRVNTPLSIAINNKDLPMIELLMNKTELGWIVEHHLTATRKYTRAHTNRHGALISAEKDEYSISQHDRLTGFRLAIIAKDDELLKFLIHLQNGKKVPLEQIPQQVVQVYKTYERDATPAIANTILKDDVEAFRLLLEFNANPNIKYKDKTAWQLALDSPNPQFFELLKAHASSNTLQELMYAAQVGHLEGVQTFIDLHGTVEKASDVKEIFRLAYAAGNVEVVKYLLSKGMTHSDLFLMAVESASVGMVEETLLYVAPKQEEIAKAIKIALKNPSEPMLELLYSLKLAAS